MKDTDFHKLIELSWVGGGFVPANENAEELTSGLKRGEVITFEEVTARDLKLHNGYFALLRFIWQYLPKTFQAKIPEKRFYQFLKHLKGKYEILYKFQDGTQMVEYESIAFGNMSNQRFKAYIKEQLPFIYEEVIGKFFEGDVYDGIVQTIEDEFEKLLAKL